MTITQLKYTLAVAEHGNFTTASEKCFDTPFVTGNKQDSETIGQY